MTLAERFRRSDPRVWQVGFLACFLAWVHATREFTLAPPVLLAGLAGTFAVQWGLVRWLGIRDPGPLSPLISALSLGLLLRTNHAWVAALAGALAMAGKFLIRVRGKHVFNPTNLGILAVVLATGRAWVSPGQWGTGSAVVFFTAALGLAVARKVARLDICLAFLGSYGALHLGRILVLGHEPSLLLHRLGSGALIVFAFFMISDPRSTPDARAGRIAFAALVAIAAYLIQFRLFVTSAPLWALLCVSPLTPVIDAIRPGRRFEWSGKGVPHDPAQPRPDERARLDAARHARRGGPVVRLLRVLRREG